MNPVFVIGHRNPDTDSICSAICYAELKHRLTGEPYIPCRAGHVNTETKFVLERFGVKRRVISSRLSRVCAMCSIAGSPVLMRRCRCTAHGIT